MMSSLLLHLLLGCYFLLSPAVSKVIVEDFTDKTGPFYWNTIDLIDSQKSRWVWNELGAQTKYGMKPVASNHPSDSTFMEVDTRNAGYPPAHLHSYSFEVYPGASVSFRYWLGNSTPGDPRIVVSSVNQDGSHDPIRLFRLQGEPMRQWEDTGLVELETTGTQVTLCLSGLRSNGPINGVTVSSITINTGEPSTTVSATEGYTPSTADDTPDTSLMSTSESTVPTSGSTSFTDSTGTDTHTTPPADTPTATQTTYVTTGTGIPTEVASSTTTSTYTETSSDDTTDATSTTSTTIAAQPTMITSDTTMPTEIASSTPNPTATETSPDDTTAATLPTDTTTATQTTSIADPWTQSSPPSATTTPGTATTTQSASTTSSPPVDRNVLVIAFTITGCAFALLLISLCCCTALAAARRKPRGRRLKDPWNNFAHTA